MKATIQNDIPTSRVRTTDAPTLRTRFSSILTNAEDHVHHFMGSPIGLLLSLTNALDFSHSHAIVFKKDFPGNVSIRNTD